MYNYLENNVIIKLYTFLDYKDKTKFSNINLKNNEIFNEIFYDAKLIPIIKDELKCKKCKKCNDFIMTGCPLIYYIFCTKIKFKSCINNCIHIIIINKYACVLIFVISLIIFLLILAEL